MMQKKWIHYINRTREVASDFTAVHKVRELIWYNFGIRALTGQYLHSGDIIRNPDLYIPGARIVIELDGYIHGQGDFVQRKDQRRNESYEAMNFELITIYAAQTDDYDDDKVIEVLRQHPTFEAEYKYKEL